MFKSKDFTKKEALDFISLFEKNTKKLTEPMVSWVAEGASTIEDAITIIEGGFIPEGFVMCAKRKNEHYWDSIYIYRNESESEEEYKYLITTDDMSGMKDEVADSIDDALKIAQTMLIEYIGDS